MLASIWPRTRPPKYGKFWQKLERNVVPLSGREKYNLMHFRSEKMHFAAKLHFQCSAGAADAAGAAAAPGREGAGDGPGREGAARVPPPGARGPERGGPPGPGPPGPGLRDAPPRGRPTGAISVPVTRYPPSPRNGKIHDIANRLTSTFANLNFSKLEN